MRPLLLVFLLSFSISLAAANANPVVSGITVQYANQTVARAAYYVALVNQSGYLIFYPNLTQSYSDLLSAESLYNTSPASAIVYANKATNEANEQYLIISNHRAESIVVTAVASIFFLLLLIRYMTPVRQARNRK